jgi:RNA-directed DNA polymerase
MNATACAPGDGGLKAGKFNYEWEKHRANVRKLQARIVKAQQLGKYNKVKALQWLLTHSFSAKTTKRDVEETRWEMSCM